ncbi:H+-transporting ATP synthase inhibitor precursor, mitochondrial [Teratosphaeria destructans]|uniref:ATPase inhibitor, mitochondrial n=1 Tax=Teratosphaeria destructans TaxID=418781 RepID=A0A9W7SKD9_9PEZI|nr:H+-transporting ATP synthase inhibitor precursor, mitochondrial [Teratosphaeria destructans]
MSALKTIPRRQLPKLSSTTTTTRSFSIAARRMAAGDTGAPRSGGAAQGDAFSKREQANEDYNIRQREMEKLKALKAKIADSEAQLAKDKKDAEDLTNKHK